jgi:hypothetical protein
MTKFVAGQMDDENGLHFRSDDRLDREEFGSRLMNLVTDNAGSMVLSLDAPWGEGKTTFLKMWQQMLTENGIRSVYLDAFQHGQAEDPFVPLVASIIDAVEAGSDAEQLEVVRTKAGAVGAHLFSWGAKFAARSATLGLFGSRTLEATHENDTPEQSSRAIAKMVADRISTYSQEVREADAFSDQLNALIGHKAGVAGKPLVVIVDELDRCSPTFAVQLLERIKHVLCVPSITYVLAYHQDQMQEAVRGVYGRGIDARAFLTKFVHIRCDLPKRTSASLSEDDYFKYCEAQLNLRELDLPRETRDGILEVLPSLARAFGLSLRTMERVFTQLTIFYTAIGEARFGSPGIVGPLAVLRVKQPDVYRSLRNGRLDYAGLVEKVSELNGPGDRGFDWCSDWLRLCFLNDKEFAKLSADEGARILEETLDAFDLTRETVVPHVCSVFDLFRRT